MPLPPPILGVGGYGRLWEDDCVWFASLIMVIILCRLGIYGLLRNIDWRIVGLNFLL